MLIAHRGASFDAPENTLAAFRLAWDQQADGIEGDYHLTVDRHIICCHDATTQRTSGETFTIADTTVDTLQKRDVGGWKHPRFAGERMPTLVEVLAVVPPGKICVIEIKCGPEIVPILDKTLHESRFPTDQIMIIAFDPQVIAAVKHAMPTVKAHWLVHYSISAMGAITPTLDEILACIRTIRADGIDTQANLSVITPAFVEAIRAVKLELHTWTVDNPQVAKTLRLLGVDSITTNRPAFLRQSLNKQE